MGIQGQIVRIQKSRNYCPYQYNKLTYSLIVDNEGSEVKCSSLQESEFVLEWLEDYNDVELLGEIILRELVGETFELKIVDFELKAGFLYEIREKEERCVPIHSINRRILCQLINTRNEPRISRKVGHIKRFAHLRYIETKELRIWAAFDIPEKHHVTKLLEFLNQNRNQLIHAEDSDFNCDPKNVLLACVKKGIFRVRIIKVVDRERFAVQLIDWGDEKIIQKSLLFKICYPVGFYPPQACPVIMDASSIGAIHPIYFNYIDERKAFSIQTISNVNPLKGQIKVRIHADYKNQDIITDFQRLLILPEVSLKNKLLTSGTNIKITINKLTKGGKFNFTIIKNGDGNFLPRLEDKIRRFANSPETYGSFPKRGLEGQKYFAIGHDNFKFKRGLLLGPDISHDESRNHPFLTVKFQVLYIDYGTTDFVLGKQLKPLSFDTCSEDALGAIGVCSEIWDKYNSEQFQKKFFNKQTLIQIASRPYHDTTGCYKYKVRFISE